MPWRRHPGLNCCLSGTTCVLYTTSSESTFQNLTNSLSSNSSQMFPRIASSIFGKRSFLAAVVARLEVPLLICHLSIYHNLSIYTYQCPKMKIKSNQPNDLNQYLLNTWRSFLRVDSRSTAMSSEEVVLLPHKDLNSQEFPSNRTAWTFRNRDSRAGPEPKHWRRNFFHALQGMYTEKNTDKH